MHLNVTINRENFPNMIWGNLSNTSLSGGLGARVFNWTAWCQVWIELKAIVHSMWNSYRRKKPYDSEIQKPNERSTLKKSHTNTTFFSSKMIRLGGWFFACFCHVLVQQGAGYSARVGASQLESGPTLPTGISTPVAWGGFHRNGGTSRKGKPLKKRQISASKWMATHSIWSWFKVQLIGDTVDGSEIPRPTTVWMFVKPLFYNGRETTPTTLPSTGEVYRISKLPPPTDFSDFWRPPVDETFGSKTS